MARQPGEYELDDDDDGGDGRIAPYVPTPQVPVLLPLILPYGHLRQGFLVWSRYGQPPNSGFANSTNQSTPQTEMATLSLIRAANQLMAELWPDRDEVTTRY